MEIKKIRVSNLTSVNGNKVPNQFEIDTPDGRYFQSYATMIAFVSQDGRVLLNRDAYAYSRTTIRYRNQFLRLNSAEVSRRIKNGDIQLVESL